MTQNMNEIVEAAEPTPAPPAVPAEHPVPDSLVVQGQGLGRDLSSTYDRVEGHLARLEGRPGPLILGPWVGEVGFELLYWIPFLRWIHATRPGLGERMVAVSRGGVKSWYHGLTSDYVDVFDVMPLEEYLQKRKDAGVGDKQRKRDIPYEREILDRAVQQLGLDNPVWLHPSVLFKALRALFDHNIIHWFRRLSVFEPLPLPDLGPLEGRLPDDYIAVKFYESRAFPGTLDNRVLVHSVLSALTEKTNVVLLNTGMQVDDHSDFEMPHPERVFRIDQLMTPPNNLTIQAAAISRARMFVGTYGGLSYLPPFFNVPSLCFYSERNAFKRYHLDLATNVFAEPQWADFIALDTRWIGGIAGSLARVAAGSDASWSDLLHLGASEEVLR